MYDEEDYSVILISGHSGHSGYFDQPKIELADPNYILTYGEFGEYNLNTDFGELEKRFFRNTLPTNIKDFKRILPSLAPTLTKKFKLKKTRYHDMPITLCTYVFMNEDHKQCTKEEDASYIAIYLSGVFMMGTGHNPDYMDSYIIRPSFDLRGKKRFKVPRYIVDKIYETCVFPNKAMIDNMFLKTLKSGETNVRSSISFNELIEKTSFTISNIISNFTTPTIFILHACREYTGDNLNKRMESSASSENFESEHFVDERMASSAASENFELFDLVNTITESSKTNRTTHKKETMVKPTPTPPPKKTRIKKGENKGYDSLVKLGINSVGGKKTKKRKY
jgi:hypothetical protein